MIAISADDVTPAISSVFQLSQPTMPRALNVLEGTIACARLIELCEARGYATWWDCATQNEPSVRLAQRLGYRNGRAYRYVFWATHAGAR